MNDFKLTKKDIISFNQEIGEKGKFNNESSLDFALGMTKTKKNWLYALSYVARSLLVDHVFEDGNKRTAFMVIEYYLTVHNKVVDKDRLMTIVRQVAKNSITSPAAIMELIYHVIKEEN